MTLVLEDGTGTVEGANSYASNAQFQAYFADRLVTVSAVAATVEAALIRATDYLSQRYRWRGYRLLPETQSLDWPREGVWTPDGVYVEGLPAELVSATIEAAKRALDEELMPDPVADASGLPVAASRDKVGPIEVERTFTGAGPSTFRKWPTIDRLVRNLIHPETGRVYRA